MLGMQSKPAGHEKNATLKLILRTEERQVLATGWVSRAEEAGIVMEIISVNDEARLVQRRFQEVHGIA